MDDKPKTFKEFQESITAKKNAVENHQSMSEYELIVRAELTDDEVYFIAWCECSNDRTDMEWEGFYRSDDHQNNFVQKMYETHRTEIERIKSELSSNASDTPIADKFRAQLNEIRPKMPQDLKDLIKRMKNKTTE